MNANVIGWLRFLLQTTRQMWEVREVGSVVPVIGWLRFLLQTTRQTWEVREVGSVVPVNSQRTEDILLKVHTFGKGDSNGCEVIII